MGERYWIDPRELIGENEFKPPHDEIFDMLFGLAMHGDLSVFFGAIPLQLIRPFSDEFKFASIPNGPEIITAIVDEALNGNLPRLWVYEKGEYFVMSDNYPGYEACIQGQPDFVPCWILGRPRNSKSDIPFHPIRKTPSSWTGGEEERLMLNTPSSQKVCLT
jgi:hypothetical protein